MLVIECPLLRLGTYGFCQLHRLIICLPRRVNAPSKVLSLLSSFFKTIPSSSCTYLSFLVQHFLINNRTIAVHLTGVFSLLHCVVSSVELCRVVLFPEIIQANAVLIPFFLLLHLVSFGIATCRLSYTCCRHGTRGYRSRDSYKQE